MFAYKLNQQLEKLAQSNGPLAEVVKAFCQRTETYNQILNSNIADTQAYHIIKHLLNELKAKTVKYPTPKGGA